MSNRGRGGRRTEREDPEQVEFKRILADLAKLEGNNVCADCEQKSPKWASATLGIFICMDCCGHHRAIGAHITFARSLTLDNWKPEHVENMKNIGNIKSNAIYEANVPPNQPKPGPYDRNQKERWIRMKYEQRRFYGNPKSTSNNNATNDQNEKPEKKKRKKSKTTQTQQPQPEPEVLFETDPFIMGNNPQSNPQSTQNVPQSSVDKTKKDLIMGLWKQGTSESPNFGFNATPSVPMPQLNQGQPSNPKQGSIFGNQDQQFQGGNIFGNPQPKPQQFNQNQGNQGSLFGNPQQNQQYNQNQGNQGSLFGNPQQNQQYNPNQGNPNQQYNQPQQNQQYNQNQGNQGSLYGSQPQQQYNQNPPKQTVLYGNQSQTQNQQNDPFGRIFGNQSQSKPQNSQVTYGNQGNNSFNQNNFGNTNQNTQNVFGF